MEKTRAARRNGILSRAVVAGLLTLALAALVGGANAAKPNVPRFKHVLVVMLENQARDDVLGSSNAPNFNSFASHYAALSRYGGLTHPSLPNYIALVSGSTHGIQDDCNDCLVSGVSLADTLRRAHLSWKTYAEGLPRPGFTGTQGSSYYSKHHVPFLYFRNVVTRRSRLLQVVPLRRFGHDLSSGRLPAFSFIVPDECHDMHDCSVATGDAWLGRFVRPLLHNPKLGRSVIFIITDEPPGDAKATDPVPALALGPLVRPGSDYSAKMSHYGLLRTIEDAWGLPRLGRSKGAAPITGIWK